MSMMREWPESFFFFFFFFKRMIHGLTLIAQLPLKSLKMDEWMSATSILMPVLYGTNSNRTRMRLLGDKLGSLREQKNDNKVPSIQLLW